MKVAIAAPYPVDPARIDGGVEAVISTLAEALARRGDVEVHVVSLNFGPPRRWRSPAGVTVHRVPLRRRFCASTRYVAEGVRIRRLIRELDPDLVHPHNTSVYARVVLGLGLPLLLQPHGIMYKEVELEKPGYRVLRGRLASWDERRILRRASNVVLINPYVARAYGSLLAGKRLFDVPNPVPDEFFELRNGVEPGLLLFAGRLIPRKGLHHLVGAARALDQRGVPFRLRVIGPPVDERYVADLRRIVSENLLEDRIEFLGMVAQEVLLDSFARCQALVLPSSEETAPMVISQAQAAGKPVVATECGGIPDLVGPGGTLVPYGDVEALADSLEEVLAGRGAGAVDRAMIRAHARETHSADRVAERMVQAYREVLRTSRRRALRVAFVGTRGLPAHGGAERVVEAVARRMPEHGIEPTVYCEKRYTPADTRVPGVRLVRLGSSGQKYLRPLVRDLGAAFHVLLSRRFDLVHLHHVEASFVLPLLRIRYPVLTTSHGAAYHRRKWGRLARRLIRAMERPFVLWSSEITFVSRRDRDDLQARFGRRGRHIPNGTDAIPELDLAGARRLRAAVGLADHRYILFIADRIIPTKGAHVAVRALDRLDGSVALLVVGDESHAPDYCRRLRDMASPAVRFHPAITDPAAVFGLMSEASCLVFPSTYEAMSLTLLEASSCGVPVVATDIGSNRDVLDDAALYFEVGDPGALATCLDELLHDAEGAARLGERARARVHSDFDWDRIAAHYAELYRSLAR